jgi:gag-polypeptide of LTR copia-type/Domain of unknown function (DUF4219)
MNLSGTLGILKKINDSNYIYWKACIESYLQSQDLWEVVGGSKTTPSKVAIEATMIEPVEDPKVKEKKTLSAEKRAETLRKWRIKVGKAMYVLRTAVEDELLKYIREASTPKVVWDTLATLFSKKSDACLQLTRKRAHDDLTGEHDDQLVLHEGKVPM